VPAVEPRGWVSVDYAEWSSAAQRPPTSEVPHRLLEELLLIWTTSSLR